MKYVGIPRLTVSPARWPFFAYLKETFVKCLSCSKNRKQMPIVPKKKRKKNYDKYFRHGKRFSRRHENCWNFDKRLTYLSFLVIFVILPRLSPNTKYLWLCFLKHLLFLGKRWSYTWSVKITRGYWRQSCYYCNHIAENLFTKTRSINWFNVNIYITKLNTNIEIQFRLKLVN